MSAQPQVVAPNTTSSVLPPADASSGTTVALNSSRHIIPTSEITSANQAGQQQSPPHPTTTGEEQALESHEVIELQTFSERKAWIEEKIKFLEKMPPIEVFVGLDALCTSAEVVPGLPTRDDLQRWLIEHDAIEKETEIFDTGELKKLRQLTKAATQRNLSPEDTDVIELTLTTIYELDKLLHLLRDRSEHLDLLGIRLTWEEHRSAGWVERRKIIEDLNIFLTTRARWNPSVYESSPEETPTNTLRRRGSLASLASVGSETSLNSAGFSRSARFKLAELLSRDAAQFSGRVTALRHGKITAAGKVLDRLIEHSRKPVPEEVLDEQDRLEEKGITELEQIGKFVMSVVMQWRKADEIYVETMKDQASATNLLEEIETAQFSHPTSRQSTSFLARTDALSKRLAIRGDPTASKTMFPCPEHPIFPDQAQSNSSLVQSLSSEIHTALDLVAKATVLAKEYHAAYQAVQQAETLARTASESSASLNNLIEQLQDGVITAEGDGTPPDLMSDSCLEPASHSVYLALLPSILKEASTACERADTLLRSSDRILGDLDIPGISDTFKSESVAEVQRLASLRDEVRQVCADATARASRLRHARKIWSALTTSQQLLDHVQTRIGSTMDDRKWKGLGSAGNSSPSSPFNTFPRHASSLLDFRNQLGIVSSQLSDEIERPLREISGELEKPLYESLSQHSSALRLTLGDAQRLLDLLALIQQQTENMSALLNEYNAYCARLETLRQRVDSSRDAILTNKLTNGHIPDFEAEMLGACKSARDDVTLFVAALPDRVLFVSRGSSPISSTQNANGYPALDHPLDLKSLDDIVRGDANYFAIQLNGHLERLSQSTLHFDLSKIAKNADVLLTPVVSEVNLVGERLLDLRRSLREINSTSGNLDTLSQLQHLSTTLHDEITLSHEVLSRSLSPIRKLLNQINTSDIQDPLFHQTLYLDRLHIVDDIDRRLVAAREDIRSLDADINQARLMEQQRLERERVAEEQRQREVAARLAAEEAERLRLEQVRLEKEENERLQRIKLAEEQARELEKQRLAEAETERRRLEHEAAEAERLRLAEVERLAEMRRLESERERAAAEEAERIRLLRERMEVEERLRLVEESLATERRLHAEAVRLAEEEAERSRLAVEEAARKAESDRLAAEARRIAEERRLAEETQRLLEEQRVAEEARRRADELQTAEKARLTEELRLAEEQRLKEVQRMVHEAEEKARMEAQLQLEEKERLAEESRLIEERRMIEVQRLVHEAEARARLETQLQFEEKERLAEELRITEERRLAEAQMTISETEASTQMDASPQFERILEEPEDMSFSISFPTSDADADIFGSPRTSNGIPRPRSQSLIDLQARILSLRKRLRSLSLDEILRPINTSRPLPTQQTKEKLELELAKILSEVSHLPRSVKDSQIATELRSLRADVDGAHESMKRITQLADLSAAVQVCDNAFSDLLEHIDSYPHLPSGPSLTHHRCSTKAMPEEQLSSRVIFTGRVIADMSKKFSPVRTDPRAVTEHGRILQTWSELEEMGNDPTGQKKSRPVSVISSQGSSGRNSSVSAIPPSTSSTKKKAAYSGLSVSSTPTRGRHLTPSHPSARRVVSGSAQQNQRRPSSQLSTNSTRSVSGPYPDTLYASTFASRQRTASLTGSQANVTPSRRSSGTPIRTPAPSSLSKRSASPTMSEASTHSRSWLGRSRASITPVSTFSRAPRDSLSSLFPRGVAPQRPTPAPRKKYVPNPKSKLDVAVGDVVNKLPVGISIEGVSETWRDQSGKYWIGDQEPKLCFCRILRSQTVMVRVGGGWSELSKFIKDHFADSFRLLPDSPQRAGEEKWISSATLSLDTGISSTEANTNNSPDAPRTPEPKLPYVPSFSLSTPSGRSPQSLRSSPSVKGSPISPLMPLQFFRRADPELLRPVTPSKTPGVRNRSPAMIQAPSRPAVWRP